MNKFKIIVPTKNSYKVMGRLINSIKDLTYNNWSVIFIDGKSNKTHINYLKEVCAKDKRFSYLKQNKTQRDIWCDESRFRRFRKIPGFIFGFR